MGRPSSSSRKKSSKKKIPKISSEARRKKRSRKIKSRKLSRRDESISSYSDDELSSSLSVSSSSSEDDFRSRKSRSHTRDVKGSRKRARRSSSSRGSSVDSLFIKKKTKKKHNDDLEPSKKLSSKKKKKKKKKKKTKKRKRDSSISLTSSDTDSCSTCQGDSDSGSERLRERSREKKKSKKKLGKGRSITRKSRDRSRSVSSPSKLSDSFDNNTIELFAIENNSRRLRSVITVVTREEESEGNGENKDEFKEEIVYDHDDYPSCRSNDSNEAGNKGELAHRTMDNVIGEDPSLSTLKASDPIFTSKKESDKYDELESSFDGAGNVSPKEKESDVKDLELILRQRALENLKRFKGGHQKNEVVPVDEKNKFNNENKLLSDVETELVPNKLAENIKRFPGGSQINEVVPLDERNINNNEMKLLSTGEAEIVQNNQPKQEDPDIMGASELSVRRSRFTWKRDSSLPTGTEEKIPPNKIGGTNSAAKKLTDATMRHLGFPSGSGEKARNVRPLPSRLQTLPWANSSLTDSTTNKRADESSQSLEESSSNTRDIGINQINEVVPPKKNDGTDSAASKLKDTLRHLGLPSGSEEKARNVSPLASRLQTLPRVKSSLTDNTTNKSPDKEEGDTSQSLAENSVNTCDIGISDASGSNALEALSTVLAEEGSSREQQNDAKDGSQFEQKTMTVMRGGELVQVNYKVYIPKKVPALARRQLKR